MAETSSTTAGAQTLLRGLAVLNAVYNGCHDLKSIGEFTGTTRSTTHRLVTVLVEQRYLRHVPTQGYQLGAKLIEFGARALESTSLYEIAQPVLQRLARYTLDTVHLGIVEGDEVLYLEKINSQRGLEMRSNSSGNRRCGRIWRNCRPSTPGAASRNAVNRFDCARFSSR